MGFRERLPPDCPPRDAQEGAGETAFRLVTSATPVAADFASNAAKQEPLPPGGNPCRWASCSLFANLDILAKKRNTFKKLRKFPFVAEITIPAGSGLLIHENGHIDFWMYDSFDPIAAVVQVRTI